MYQSVCQGRFWHESGAWGIGKESPKYQGILQKILIEKNLYEYENILQDEGVVLLPVGLEKNILASTCWDFVRNTVGYSQS